MLWIGWGVLSFWQIGTIRYFKTFFKFSTLFHIINGTFIVLVTLIFCLKGIALLFWTISSHWHAYVGIFITMTVLVVPTTGFFAA